MGLLALLWGSVAASATLIGAAFAWYFSLPRWVLAVLMAFGSSILLSLVAYEIVHDAFDEGGLRPTVIGYAIGASLFTLGLLWLDRAGARDRKRSAPETVGSVRAVGIVALATILDSVPESLIIGLNFFNGEQLALATVVAVFLSNIPESVSSTTRMKMAGFRAIHVAGIWLLVTAAGGLATFSGYMLLHGLSDESAALTQSIAGGALLVMIVDTMIPEAFSEAREGAGFIAALGFLTGFILAVGLG